MEFYTEMKIGICNAWIGSLIAYLSGMSIMIINRRVGERLSNMSFYTKKDMGTLASSFIMQYGFIIFSIWIPFKLNTWWFYTGLLIFTAALICYMIALKNYAAAPDDEAVTKGLYKISRNPLYLFYSLMSLSLCVASASLPLFIIWILYNLSVHMIILGEEKYCLKTYGLVYSNYMETVRRYI